MVRNNILKLKANGDLDSSFVATLNYPCYDIVVQADGKILISGDFTEVNGNPGKAVARLLADGSTDTTFNPPPFVNVDQWGNLTSVSGRTLALQPDGKIWVGGAFTGVGSYSYTGLVRLHADGQVDPTLIPGTAFTGYQSSKVTEIALQPDGKLLVGGTFKWYNGQDLGHLIRIEPNGFVDTTFASGDGLRLVPPYSSAGDPGVNDLDLFPDGRIAVVGEFTRYNFQWRPGIIVLNADGTVDNNYQFGQGINPPPRAVLAMPDGSMIINGTGTYNGSLHLKGVTRLHANGSVDPAYKPGVSGGGALARLGDGRVAASLHFGQLPSYRQGIALIHADGSLDHTFGGGSGVTGMVYAVSELPNGKLMVHGRFGYLGGHWSPFLGRLMPDGSADPTFTLDGKVQLVSGASASMGKCAVRPDGRALLMAALNDGTGFRLHQFLPTGTLDPSFHSAVNDMLSGILQLQDDGKLIIAGNVRPSYGSRYFGVERLMPDGSLDPDFLAGTGTLDTLNYPDSLTNYAVNAIAFQGDGKILLGGSFRMYNGIPAYGIVRLMNDGTYDPTFNSGTGFADPQYLPDSVTIFRVGAIDVRPDGRILVWSGGGMYNGMAVGNIIQLLPDGSIDPSFDVHAVAGATPVSLTLQADGHYLVGLKHADWYSDPTLHLVSIDPQGQVEPVFDLEFGYLPSPLLYPDLSGIFPNANGDLIVHGNFISFNGTGRNRIARLHAPGVPTAVPADREIQGLAPYPNPATDLLRLSNVDPSAHVLIRNTLGQVVFDGKYGAPLDVSGLDRGIYMVEVPSRHWNAKFVKQ